MRHYSLLFVLLAFFTACVGTVADKNAPITNVLNNSSSSNPVSFDGIAKANPISHDKVELLFRPASGGSDIIYELYVNNSVIPYKLNPKALTLTPSGFYYFCLTGLRTGTTYMFNMRVVSASGAQDPLTQLDPLKNVYATTFNNETADFLGISNVTLAAGAAGKNTVTVKWNQATILGTDLKLRDTDPIAYEVTYISSVGGASNLNNPYYTGLDRKVLRIPSTYNTPPSISRVSSLSIGGLTEGTTYYFQVRAIHYGYYKYSSDPYYKSEENTKFLKVKTLSDTGVFDFGTESATLTHPLGFNGLSALDVSWLGASGSFYNYKVCYKKVAAPDATPPVDDQLLDTELDRLFTDTETPCINVSAENTTVRLTGLTSYAYYQVKALACLTAACAVTERINSVVLSSRVVTNLASFSGILTAFNPTDESNLDIVTLNFDPPLVDTGYLTRMKFYCYDGASDTTPVTLPVDGSVSSTIKPACSGIAVTPDYPYPTSLSEYGNFSNLGLKLTQPIDGTRTYCLSLVPVIESSYMHQENLEGASVKCFIPEIKVPTMTEFPGRDPFCSSSTGRELTITWPEPQGGLYTKFIVLYKEKTVGTDFFSFRDAVAAYTGSTTATGYHWAEVDKGTFTYTINGLAPGKTYAIGVLTYLVNGSLKLYSEYNLEVGDCFLPLPKAVFSEWVDIFAVGPKENGLVPPTSIGAKTNILETLDEDGIPVEIAMTTDTSLDLTDALAASRTSIGSFDGVYGARNGNSDNSLQQYSNSGIVRLVWKDVYFITGKTASETAGATETITSTASMAEFINSYETTTIKANRLYGYRIYRSDDNRINWIDLTAKSLKNRFQTTGNSGLVHPMDLTWRARNNLAGTTEKMVSFTDYSVRYAGESGAVDRARVYWYKIVPVYDGKELVYDDESNPEHNIIRVTLPPRNMALVHRLVANRMMCLELGKAIDKKAGKNYTCKYNGVGATGSVVGETVYDLRGDLLIDRFELSCPFTRGDRSLDNSDSDPGAQTKLTFGGKASNGNAFKGCFNDASLTYEPGQGTPPVSGSYAYNQIAPGDCFGAENVNYATLSANACGDPTKNNFAGYFLYPGSPGVDMTPNCQDSAQAGYNAFNVSKSGSLVSSDNTFFPAQSEYAGVYYMRRITAASSWFSYTPFSFPAGNGKTLEFTSTRTFPSACNINLSYVASDGTYKPRWIPLNAIFDRLKISGTTTSISLYDKTLNQVQAITNLYDSDTVIAPTLTASGSTRYDPASTKLGRIMSSNSSHLPPLEGFTQTDANKICELYQVQVGFQAVSGSSFVPSSDIKSKRLSRRNEHVLAAAWPSHYSEAKVTSIEEGTYEESSVYKGCNSSERIVNSGGGIIVGLSGLEKGDYIKPAFPLAAVSRPRIMVGSSSLDGNAVSSDPKLRTSTSTEKCVSRYGVQDIVGNMAELNSDQIFCDYSKNVLYLGLSETVSNSLLYGGGWFDHKTLKAWSLPDPDSGACSLVAPGDGLTGNYTSGSNMAPIYTYSGLNTDFIFQGKTIDQDSLSTARNGDGSFLSFGQKALAPRIDNTDDFSMTASSTPANYFSPILGMPLTCGGVTCANGAEDNKDIITKALVATKGYDDAALHALGVVIPDFPTNNSVITNDGLAVVRQTDGYSTNNSTWPSVQYIANIDLGATESILDNNPLYQFSVQSEGAPWPIAGLQSWNYLVPRTSTLKMESGGSSTTSAGRYTLKVFSRGDSEERYPVSSVLGTARCAVLINQDVE